MGTKFKVGDVVVGGGGYSFDPSVVEIVEDTGDYYECIVLRSSDDASLRKYRQKTWCYYYEEVVEFDGDWDAFPFVSPYHQPEKLESSQFKVGDRVRVKEDTDSEATKHDNSKPRIDLVPPEFIFAVSEILTFGAEKYADRNWEKGMSWGRVFGACMRHMWAWWGGKGPSTENFVFGSLDTETGKSHLWHAACCLAFLVAYEERNVGTDDRAN